MLSKAKLTLFWAVFQGIPLLCLGKALIGVRLRHFENRHGRLLDSSCCDVEDTEVLECPPDLCDTVFQICMSNGPQEDKDCIRFPVVFNNNSFDIGDFIGSGEEQTSSSYSFSLEEKSKATKITIHALEYSGNRHSMSEIATLSHSVDWVDTNFRFQPEWHHVNLKSVDDRVLIHVDIFSMCKIKWTGKNCTEPALDKKPQNDEPTKAYCSDCEEKYIKTSLLSLLSTQALDLLEEKPTTLARIATLAVPGVTRMNVTAARSTLLHDTEDLQYTTPELHTENISVTNSEYLTFTQEFSTVTSPSINLTKSMPGISNVAPSKISVATPKLDLSVIVKTTPSFQEQSAMGPRISTSSLPTTHLRDLYSTKTMAASSTIQNPTLTGINVSVYKPALSTHTFPVPTLVAKQETTSVFVMPQRDFSKTTLRSNKIDATMSTDVMSVQTAPNSLERNENKTHYFTTSLKETNTTAPSRTETTMGPIRNDASVSMSESLTKETAQKQSTSTLKILASTVKPSETQIDQELFQSVQTATGILRSTKEMTPTVLPEKVSFSHSSTISTKTLDHQGILIYQRQKTTVTDIVTPPALQVPEGLVSKLKAWFKRPDNLWIIITSVIGVCLLVMLVSAVVCRRPHRSGKDAKEEGERMPINAFENPLSAEADSPSLSEQYSSTSFSKTDNKNSIEIHNPNFTDYNSTNDWREMALRTPTRIVSGAKE